MHDPMSEALKRRKAKGVDLTIMIGAEPDQDDQDMAGKDPELAPEIKDSKESDLDGAEESPMGKLDPMSKGPFDKDRFMPGHGQVGQEPDASGEAEKAIDEIAHGHAEMMDGKTPKSLAERAAHAHMMKKKS